MYTSIENLVLQYLGPVDVVFIYLSSHNCLALSKYLSCSVEIFVLH